jgi:hypothetical protein
MKYDNTLHIQYIQSNIKCGKIDGIENKNSNFSYIQSLYNSSSIIYSFIQYIKDNYPKVEYITLIDEANYNCDEMYNSSNISLSIYYFLKYMKLYYMKKYNFKIYDINKDEEENKIKKFKKIVKLYKNNKILNNEKINKILFYLKNKCKKYKKNPDYFNSLISEIKIIKKKLIKYKHFDIFLQKHKFIHCYIFYHIIYYFLEIIDKKIYYYLHNIHKLNFRYKM